MSIDLKHYPSINALRQASTCVTSVKKQQIPNLVPATDVARIWCPPCLMIRLIIQTIRRDPSVWTDGASNLSRPDPSGAVWIDAETRLRIWRLEVRIPRGAHKPQLRGSIAREAGEAVLGLSLLEW
jgi:hypothetical protein